MSKKEKRRTARELLLSLSGEQKLLCDKTLCENLEKAVQPRPGMLILSYLAAGNEADPAAFDETARRAGASVAYPVCTGEGKMDFYLPGEVLRQNRYGIREPEPDPARRADPAAASVILVPCLAFDRSGGRLGHGGGYYDRYLARCPGAKRILVAFRCQEQEEIPMEAHDVPMEFVVTDTDFYPAGCYNTKEQNTGGQAT